MTLQEIKEKLDYSYETDNGDGSKTIHFPFGADWTSFFYEFCKENETWCDYHLTEANFETTFRVFGSGFNKGLEYASHFNWKH